MRPPLLCKGRCRARSAGVAAIAAAILAVAPPLAVAEATGTLTTAEADSAWTQAHIAGSMTEDGP
jgi:hypothetical protein